jgi:DNA-binding CsgD family transcriptional regulator
MTKPNNDQEIIDLYNSGLSNVEVSNRKDISPSQVRRILWRNGFKGRSTKLETETEQLILKRYLSGESSEKIAKDLGITAVTVCKVIKRNNVKIRPASENKTIYRNIPGVLDNIDTEEKAYFIGWMIAKSCTRNTNFYEDIKLDTSKGKEYILERFAKILYENPPPLHGEGSIYLNISNSYLINKINEYCSPERFPFDLEEKFYNHVLRGMYDFSGGINREYVGPQITLYGTADMAKDIQELLGIELSVLPQKKIEDSYTMVSKAKNKVKYIIEYLYKDATIYLTHKKEKADIALGTLSR